MTDIETCRVEIAQILDTEASEVKLDTPLRGNESWDSFARLAAVALISKRTGKAITIDDLAKLETVCDLIAILKLSPGLNS